MRYGWILALLLLTACSTTGKFGSPERLAYEKSRYEARPEDPDSALRYASNLLGAGQAQEGLLIMQARPTPLQTKEEWLLMAQLYKAIDGGEASEGKRLQALHQALKQDPQDITLRKMLIAIYKKNNDLKGAQSLYDEVLYCPDEVVKLDLSEHQYAQLVDEASLNLVAQDLFQDAYDLMQIAQVRYPNNEAIERNVRITRALVQSNGHSSPKPAYKPEFLSQVGQVLPSSD